MEVMTAWGLIDPTSPQTRKMEVIDGVSGSGGGESNVAWLWPYVMCYVISELQCTGLQFYVLYFSIFSAVMPRSSPSLFNLAQNSVVQSPSSVIRDPRYGNVSICSS